VIPLSIVALFGITYLGISIESKLEYESLVQQTKEIEMNSPPIEITGTVRYVVSLEGPNYQLIPEPIELSKFGESNITVVNLGPSWISDEFFLTSDLADKKVTVKGVFIENPVGFHVQYSTVKPVIVVKELTVLE